ncbi:MAG: hypothetical protein HYX24_04960 [Candidatus Aenigmarchaeota archaeon]|nr:hypothetical protein [Candidatus Aenigmarchaeota archaeon]
MPLKITPLGDGRIEVIFDHPIAPLSGQTLSTLFALEKGDEMISKGKGVVGIRAFEQNVEKFLNKLDKSGKARREYAERGKG